MDATVTALPELGPHLGRLCALAEPGERWVVLDDIRLDLATGVLELAAAARGFGDDRGAVVASLRRHEWLGEWDKALTRAAERTVETIDGAFAAAAAVSRYPARRLAALRVTGDERDAISARLGAGAAPFVAALDRMDQLTAAAAHRGAAGEAAFAAWWHAVIDVARKLEAAWESLERAARAEQERWTPEIAVVRTWRRPAWPLWTVTALVVSVALGLGLVLGGYLRAPGWLRPFAELWWSKVPVI
jgi:hypothetical protein